MASKMVTDRQKGADAVAAIAAAQGATLSQSIRSVLAAADSTHLVQFVSQLTTTLSESRDKMVIADANHERELADDPAARDERDRAVAELTAKLVEVRELLTGLYGSTTARQVLPQATPQDPVVLARFAAEVSAQLGKVTLPASRIQGAHVDPTQVASEVVALERSLEGKLQAVAREVREAQDTLAKKNRAIEEYDRVFRGVATILAGLFTLANQDELAEKVRPSARRPGRTREQEQTEPEQTDPGVAAPA